MLTRRLGLLVPVYCTKQEIIAFFKVYLIAVLAASYMLCFAKSIQRYFMQAQIRRQLLGPLSFSALSILVKELSSTNNQLSALTVTSK